MTKSNSYSKSIGIISNHFSEKSLFYLLLGIFFLLRFPTLFEPLFNDHETYLLTIAADLLPGSTSLFVPDILLVTFGKIAFVLFGTTLWSVKFLLFLYFFFFLIVSHFLTNKIFGYNKSLVLTIVFVLILGSPYFGANQLNYSLFLPPAFLLCLFLFYKLHFKRQVFSKFLAPISFAICLILFFGLKNPFVSSSYYFDFVLYSFDKVKSSSNADEKYFSSFDKNIKQSYSLAFFLEKKTSKEDSIFVVGKEVSIYFLSRRRAASNTVILKEPSSVDQALTDVVSNKPSYILYSSSETGFGELDRILTKFYNLAAQENNVKIYSRKVI
jgi:hypothetical protein